MSPCLSVRLSLCFSQFPTLPVPQAPSWGFPVGHQQEGNQETHSAASPFWGPPPTSRPFPTLRAAGDTVGVPITITVFFPIHWMTEPHWAGPYLGPGSLCGSPVLHPFSDGSLTWIQRTEPQSMSKLLFLSLALWASFSPGNTGTGR